MTLIGNVATVAVLFVGGVRVADGGLALGVLTAFLLYLREFYGPMEDVAMFFNSLQSATAALEKLALVLAEEPAVPEPADPARAAAPAAGEMRLRVGASSATTRRPSGRGPCCTSSTCASPAARRWRWSAPPAPARPPSPS